MLASCCTHTHPQDFSDPDTQLSVAGVVLGLLLGLGAPAFYINRTERDEERLEELRALNRAQYQETGEYMSDVSACTGVFRVSCVRWCYAMAVGWQCHIVTGEQRWQTCGGGQGNGLRARAGACVSWGHQHWQHTHPDKRAALPVIHAG